MQLLTKTPPLREIDIQEKLNEVKASKRTKWNALRQKLEHVLEDKADI